MYTVSFWYNDINKKKNYQRGDIRRGYIFTTPRAEYIYAEQPLSIACIAINHKINKIK